MSRYKYIFIKIPRTATSSMNEVLQQYRGHATAQQWLDKVGPHDFNNAYKFTVVRHPLTKFVSAYYHQKKANNNYIMPINEYIKNGIPNEIVFRPQYTFVYDWQDNLMVDKIYRFEELKTIWADICKKCGVFYQELPHNHKTEEKKQKLSEESKEFLYDYYKEDFKRFNYEIRDNITTKTEISSKEV